ncbi:MAG: transposase, partial [Gemmatimonadetes bacterium]|nr:transposase [Gemmatimonadota bacterium]
MISSSASNWVDRGEAAEPKIAKALRHFLGFPVPDPEAELLQEAGILVSMVAADASEVQVAAYLGYLEDRRDRERAPAAHRRLEAIAIWHIAKAALTRDRAVRLRWRKRIWSCTDVDCHARTWTEQSALAEPRRVLSTRAAEWACDRVAGLEGTPSSIARDFGVAWSTVWSAVERIGRARVDDAERVGPVAMVGFDETVMQPAHRRRRRRFVTAVVDVATGQLLDVFEGRDARHLRAWMAGLAPSWLSQVQVVSLDPHEGYRSAVVGSDPVTGQVSLLSHAAVVV